jgi:putative spermidine/putrescine transport system ATP-binding protein
MEEPYLRLNNLHKSYDGGRNNAVAGVDLGIRKGEFISLLGPSGSGKTTCLMMIAGFEHPSSGSIQLAGSDLTLSKPYHRNIGTVFQNYALFPHMSVERNIAFPLKLRRVPKHEQVQRVNAALDLVGLSDLARRYPRTLSGGQQQRVALARSLVFRPDVLLLDEPLGALDKNMREQMQVELKRIHREVGITMIYVTHDQTEAMAMSDRIAVFNRGRLEQVAAPTELYLRPNSRFVGEFVGDSNFFKAAYDPTDPDRAKLQNGRVLNISGLSGAAALRNGGRKEFDILVRPQSLRLVDPGQSSRDPTVAPWSIQEMIHYGDNILLLCGGELGSCRIRIPGTASHSLSLGQTIYAGWDVASGHALVS